MMRAGTHLHHLTLTTGSSRRSWHHEIEPGVLSRISELLAAALDGSRVALPVDPAGLTLQATGEGRCLLCTVWHDELPLVTFGVAAHSRCGAQLWRMLCARVPALVNRDRAPQEPWCAALLEPGLSVMGDVAAMLGDLERCVAWAWLDRLEP